MCLSTYKRLSRILLLLAWFCFLNNGSVYSQSLDIRFFPVSQEVLSNKSVRTIVKDSLSRLGDNVKCERSVEYCCLILMPWCLSTPEGTSRFPLQHFCITEDWLGRCIQSMVIRPEVLFYTVPIRARIWRLGVDYVSIIIRFANSTSSGGDFRLGPIFTCLFVPEVDSWPNKLAAIERFTKSCLNALGDEFLPDAGGFREPVGVTSSLLS